MAAERRNKKTKRLLDLNDFLQVSTTNPPVIDSKHLLGAAAASLTLRGQIAGPANKHLSAPRRRHGQLQQPDAATQYHNYEKRTGTMRKADASKVGGDIDVVYTVLT